MLKEMCLSLNLLAGNQGEMMKTTPPWIPDEKMTTPEILLPCRGSFSVITDRKSQGQEPLWNDRVIMRK